MSKARATFPRAWSTEVLKNSVPASATATKASPNPPAAVSSIRVDRPVRPAPEAPLRRCTNRLAPSAAAAPARPARCDAVNTDRPARRARSPVPVFPMAQVFFLAGVGQPWRGHQRADNRRRPTVHTFGSATNHGHVAVTRTHRLIHALGRERGSVDCGEARGVAERPALGL